MLSDIFRSTPPQEIERAVRMSDGNISLAAHKILTDSEGKSLPSSTFLYFLHVDRLK